MEPTSKAWWQSKGVWGGVIASLATILNMMGFQFGIESQEATVEMILSLITTVSALIATYGRVVATQPIAAPPIGKPDGRVLVLAGLCLIAVSALSAPAMAIEKGVQWPGPFKVQVLSVTDGDTVEVLFRDGPCTEGGRGAPCQGNILALRIRGIDTPEKKLCQKRRSQSCAACPEEEKLGKAATEFARALLVGKLVAQARDLGKDPYFGRIVGSLDVLHEGRMRSFADLIQEAGLAVRYEPLIDGSYTKSKGWCPKPQS
jgi:endonuclease YncB( thermonuclease family)